MAAINPKNIFPEINIERLKFYAVKWAEGWPAIERITLYPGAEGESKYFLVVAASKAPPEGTSEFDLWEKQNQTYRDSWADPINESICAPIRNDLISVYYKDVPPDGFLNQWTCWNYEPGDGLFSNEVDDPSYRAPIVEDPAYCVCLYSAEGDDYDDEPGDYDEWKRNRKEQIYIINRLKTLDEKPSLTPEEHDEIKELEQKRDRLEEILHEDGNEVDAPTNKTEENLISTVKGKKFIGHNPGMDAHILLQMVIGGLPAYKPYDRSPLVDGSLSGTVREMAVMRVLGPDPGKAVSELLFDLSELEEFLEAHRKLGPLRIPFREKSGPKLLDNQQDTKEYKKNAIGHIPDEVFKLTRKVRPEAEKIYSAMKSDKGGSGFSRYVADPAECHKNEALAWCREHRDEFKYLNETILDDINLYQVSIGQPKRDIIGKILQKYIEQKTKKKFNLQKLYRKTKNST